MFKLISGAVALILAASVASADIGIYVLGESGGGGAAVMGFSGNASVATGVSDGRVFRWTPSTGLTYISPQSYLYTSFANVSADGSTIVSTVADHTGMFSAARWTTQGGWQNLGGLPGQSSPDGQQISSGYGLNADGSVAVGLGWHTDYSAEGFRWAQATGMVGLGQPPAPGRSSRASNISANGSTIVGFFEHPQYGNRRPVRWVNGGAADLFLGAEMVGEATATSSDGSVIVGGATLDGINQHAFIYSDAHGATDLGLLYEDPFGFGQSFANGISDNGIVVGWSGDPFFGPIDGFVWTGDRGMMSAADYLSGYGLSVPQDWVVSSITAISADGSAIGGQMVNMNTFQTAGWIAITPEPASIALLGLAAAAVIRRRR